MALVLADRSLAVSQAVEEEYPSLRKAAGRTLSGSGGRSGGSPGSAPTSAAPG